MTCSKGLIYSFILGSDSGVWGKERLPPHNTNKLTALVRRKLNEFPREEEEEEEEEEKDDSVVFATAAADSPMQAG
jgi:hypothetical protein